MHKKKKKNQIFLNNITFNNKLEQLKLIFEARKK